MLKNLGKNFEKIKEKNIKENNINKIINNNKPKIKQKDNKKLKEKKPDKIINQKITQIKDYTKPTLIGLNNIGATCFINATLQCLSQTKALTNYFLNENNKDKIINNNIALKNKSENQLTPCYLELINKLWNKTPSGTKSVSPSNFVQKLNEMNPLFKLGEAGDSKDFIIYILEQIHRELSKTINLNNKIPEALNQYDKKNAFDNFFYEFKTQVSIISDIFFGINETTSVCLNCKTNYNARNQNNPICYNYGIFNCLIFPLEEVKNLKLKNNMNQGINNSDNIVNIYDCFNFYQKSDLFTGDNKYFCNICKQLYDSIYTCKIFTSPNYLILILNRGKGNIYNVKLDFPEIINITDYVLEKESPKIIYSLYGVVTHIGQSGPNAHFIASCKSPVDGKWYRYNDAIVNMITDVKKEIIDFGTPYILFYQKEK
jgi:ubiquitin C-terminal hydrolase